MAGLVWLPDALRGARRPQQGAYRNAEADERREGVETKRAASAARGLALSVSRTRGKGTHDLRT